MRCRHIAGIVLLKLSLSGFAFAASLPDAAEQRDEASVRILLHSGADANAAQVDGTTALHWAAYHDDAEMVGLLVRAGADVNAVNRYGASALAEASTNGNAAIIKLLLEAGADANTRMKGGETALMLAARSGNPETVRALLGHGASPDQRERRNQTALMWAAAEGHVEVVRALIDAGAGVNARLDSGFTPFLLSVREGHLDVVRAFIEAGVDVNAMMRPAEGWKFRGGPPARCPLQIAVRNGHFELAIALVDAGADPNDVRTGFTALHLIPGVRKPDSNDLNDGAPPKGAGRLSSADFVREIVKRGADVDFRLPRSTQGLPGTTSRIATVGAAGATPLLLAADRSDVPLMRLLLELGSDPLLPNFNNTTPLMAAAGVGTTSPDQEAGEESEALEAVRLLLDLGADLNTVDNNGDTAMHGAAYNAYPLVANLLAERGADPQVWKKPNQAGGTPLFIAEGYADRSPQPDAKTIEAITKLMLAAGISTKGERPEIVDIYERR